MNGCDHDWKDTTEKPKNAVVGLFNYEMPIIVYVKCDKCLAVGFRKRWAQDVIICDSIEA